MRHRRQEGSLNPISRVDGSKVWEYRWRERQPNGKLRDRCRVIGELKDLPTRGDAWDAIEKLDLNINHNPTPNEV